MEKHNYLIKESRGSSSKWIALYLLLFLVFGSNAAFAQNHSVTGVVKEAGSNEPLIGVTVSVKDSPNVGTMTDMDGRFNLKGVNPKASLVFSYIGFDKQVVAIAGRSVIDIEMSENATQLGEVQVVAYGVQKKVTVTGALSSMSGDDLLKTPTGSITNALAGKMTGVSSIQYSGEPGADMAEIFIRGVTTTNNATPLIQVDGVERDFSQIDPNEIENITILKDASATAVFGVRGANGVILVTTKRGSEGRAKITASTSFGVNIPTRLVDFANSYQYATYYNEAQRNDGIAESQLRFSPEALAAFRDHTDPILYPDIDWMDYILKSSSLQSQHNLNISGGTDRIKYFISVGMFDQDGLFKTFAGDENSKYSYKRYNYRSNIDFDITKSTTLSLNVGGRVEDKHTPISKEDQGQLFRHLYWATPFGGAGIVNGDRIVASKDIFGDKTGIDGLEPFYGRGYRKRLGNNLDIDLSLNQKLDFLTKGLVFRVKGSYNTYYDQTKERASSKAVYSPRLNNLANPSDGYVLELKQEEGRLGYGEWHGNSRNWYFETSMGYNRSFEEHTLGALLLYNQSKRYYPAKYTDIPTGYVGLVGRVSYDYKQKYMAEFNAGYNGSENFRSGKRYGFFPAGSVGWVVTGEDFMKSLDVVSHLKVRASWGLVGNDRYGDERFMYLSDSYAFGGGYNFGTNVGSNKPGAYEMKKNDPNVTWETAFKQNYGIDLYFLADRLKLNADMFWEHRKDILVQPQTIPGIIGIGLPVMNNGIVDSRGYELQVGWADKITDDMRYWVSTNMSFARNEIIEMNEVRQSESYLQRTGHAVGQPFLRKFWGFYDETANERYKAQYGHDIAEHSGAVLKPGDAVYVDLNNDGVIDEKDEMALGYTNLPRYTAGLNLGFQYKGFDISMQWTGAWNSSRILQETFRDPMGETADRGLVLTHYEDRWTPETASSARWPRASMEGRKNNTANSDLYLVDASYLRLKSVELGYSFDMPFMEKAKISSLRLYTSGYNLLTFDSFKFGDPESRTSDRPNYPLTRVINFGLKIGF